MKTPQEKITSLLAHSVVATALGAAATSPSFALEKTDPIDTNRPSFCESALVVPKGTLQLENGLQYQKLMSGANYFDISETQVRLGATKRTEFAMFVPQWVLFSRTGRAYDGASGLGEVGFKQQIFDRKHLQLSLIGGLNLPTGSKRVSGTAVQGVIRLPYAIPLNKNWTINGMQSILVMNSGGDIQYQPFVMVTRNIGSNAACFAEYAGFFQQNSHKPSQQIAHFGGVYKIKNNHQVDMHFGFGMTKSSPAAFVGAGYSYRFNRLPW